jgi:hypothetical protein
MLEHNLMGKLWASIKGFFHLQLGRQLEFRYDKIPNFYQIVF